VNIVVISILAKVQIIRSTQKLFNQPKSILKYYRFIDFKRKRKQHEFKKIRKKNLGVDFVSEYAL